MTQAQVVGAEQAAKSHVTVMQAWLDELKRGLDSQLLLTNAVRVGVFYTAAQISSGHVGVAFTPRDLADTVCCPKSAAQGLPVGKMIGRRALELAEFGLSQSPLRRAVGTAVLNALSALAIERWGVGGAETRVGVDALAAAEVGEGDSVAMVGAFAPFIRKLRGKVARLRVIDKHRDTLKPEELEFWRPPEEAVPVLSDASVVLITGSALVEGGLDELLAAASGARRVVMAGPTASPWPPPFFERGVDILGGIRVRDGFALLNLVSEGGSGYSFESVAEKVCIIRPGL